MENRQFYLIIKNLLIGIFLCSFLGIGMANAQDDPVKVRMSLSYSKIGEDTKKLTVILKYKEEKEFKKVENAEVTFWVAGDTSDILMGTSMTNVEGKADFVLPDGFMLPKDTATNLYTFKATFEGSEKFRAAERELEIKDIRLSLKLEVVDSVKHVFLTANELNHDGSLNPVNETDVTFYVPRLYSYLPVGEGWIDGGEAEFEFPDDIPGRDNGELAIIARIEDHDVYGNVEVRQDIDWGTPVSFKLEEVPRVLWGRAPAWMIVAIIVVLLGAWYHFILAVYKLSKVKKLGKQSNA